MLKNIVTVVVFLATAYGGFKIDQYLFYLILNEVPDNSEWVGLIKIVLAVILFMFTAATIIWFSFLMSAIVNIFFKSYLISKEEEKHIDKVNKTVFPKSRFYQKLMDKIEQQNKKNNEYN